MQCNSNSVFLFFSFFLFSCVTNASDSSYSFNNACEWKYENLKVWWEMSVLSGVCSHQFILFKWFRRILDFLNTKKTWKKGTNFCLKYFLLSCHKQRNKSCTCHFYQQQQQQSVSRKSTQTNENDLKNECKQRVRLEQFAW